MPRLSRKATYPPFDKLAQAPFFTFRLFLSSSSFLLLFFSLSVTGVEWPKFDESNPVVAFEKEKGAVSRDADAMV